MIMHRTEVFQAVDNQSKEKIWKKKEVTFYRIFFFLRWNILINLCGFFPQSRGMFILVIWVVNYFMKDKIY